MDDWVLDSLVGFLKSPTWSDPIKHFTDQNCVVFDPGEENKFSYTDIHKEYQKLVEDLLESFTSDLGISGDQFTQACSHLQASKAGQENEELFEQVLAADDFLLFKGVMVQRNIDLELQALTLLKKQMGHSPVVYDRERAGGDPVNSPRKSAEEEEKMLEEAMKMSEAQYNLERSLDDEQLQQLIEQAKQESLRLYQQQQMKTEQEKGRAVTSSGESIENTARRDRTEVTISSVQDGQNASLRGSQPEQRVPQVEEKAAQPHTQSGHPETETAKETVNQTTALPPLEGQTHPPMGNTGEKMSVNESGVGSSSGEAMAKWLEGARSHLHSESSQTNAASGSSHSSEPTPEQLKAREMYLKRQRDHLLQMKKQHQAHVCHPHTTRTDGSKQPKPATPSAKSSKRPSTTTDVKDRRRGRDTGILSSAIASSLKKI